MEIVNTIATAFDNVINMLTYDATSPMLFSSGLFWLLFIFFIPIYAMLRNNKVQMMLFVTLFSLYFYYKSSGFFLLLLVATSLCDYFISKAIVKSRNKKQRKYLTLFSIVVSVGVLCYFKYANFFVWNWSQIVQTNFQPLDIILPIGISFYTFRSISYVVDVYKGKISTAGSWLEYVFFLSFFPALLAGPIVRAETFLPQLKQKSTITSKMIYSGFWLVIIGIVKKAIFADYIAQYNDLVFDQPGFYHGVEALCGLLGYTMQIYCDFSGYSDMAIGIGLIMGFDLGVNFDSPYQSKNLTEFWRRWHISLSSWLRDYIYIPLGGNRKGTIRTYLNNFLTMLIGGLWHGAAWKFIFWGAMHGAGLAVHKACKPVLSKIPDNWFVKTISCLITFIFVSLLWVFFRADSFESSITLIASVFDNFDMAYFPVFWNVRYEWCIMMAILIISHFTPQSWTDKCRNAFISSPWFVKLLLFVIVVQFVIQYMSEEVTPFIYNQF